MTHRCSLLVWIMALTLVACGGAPPLGAEIPDDAEAAAAPLPRNADELAAKAVGAKLTALVFVGQLRDHPLASKVAAMDAWGPIFDGTDIEPLKDVDRAFVAAGNLRDSETVIAVAEHHVEPARVEQAIDTLVERSGADGKRLDEFAFSAARVKVDGRKSLVMAVTPELLVVTSESHADAAAKLAQSGGLPDPSGPEAVIAAAQQPATSLKARGVPKIPSTIEAARMTVTMKDGGGALVHLVGDSTNPKQAKKDAAVLTKRVDKATTVKISFIKVRAFAPVAFKAKGSRVEAKRHVTAAELQTLLSFAQMLAK